MEIPIYQVDAFTDTPFRGNPAGVCVLDSLDNDEWMQNVALEMNLSETAFVAPRGERFHLRWFTPVREVPLCGHATLATAHILWETGRLPRSSDASFDSLSGPLAATRGEDEITLDFPQFEVEEASRSEAVLREVLGVELVEVSSVPKGLGEFNYIVELASERDVRELVPNLRPIADPGSPGVIVTARADETDYVCRYFVPAAGIDEDPVTGSANCALACYWAPRLGKTELTSLQASARGGKLRLELVGDRVRLSGQATTTLRGDPRLLKIECGPKHSRGEESPV